MPQLGYPTMAQPIVARLGPTALARQASLEAVKNCFDRPALHDAWSACDKNGSKNASLAEVDGMIDYYARTQAHKFNGFFKGMHNSHAIIRAFHFTRKSEASSDGDDWIQKKEFPALLKNLHFFNQIYRVFNNIDESGDMRIDASEFSKGVKALGIRASALDARDMFNEIDNNGGGYILFDEFCRYCTDASEKPMMYCKGLATAGISVPCG